jgi:Cu(I)/Ag(I) efflux system membrane protein CusA/SilA
MIEKIIEYSAHNRFLVLIATALIIGWGTYSVSQTPIDAIPDLSDVQVIVQSNWGGQSPQEIEDQMAQRPQEPVLLL